MGFVSGRVPKKRSAPPSVSCEQNDLTGLQQNRKTVTIDAIEPCGPKEKKCYKIVLKVKNKKKPLPPQGYLAPSDDNKRVKKIQTVSTTREVVTDPITVVDPPSTIVRAHTTVTSKQTTESQSSRTKTVPAVRRTYTSLPEPVEQAYPPKQTNATVSAKTRLVVRSQS